jgi:hypothetical protein
MAVTALMFFIEYGMSVIVIAKRKIIMEVGALITRLKVGAVRGKLRGLYV